MNTLSKNDSIQLIRNCLGVPYNENKFRQLVANIFPNTKTFLENEISEENLPNIYRQHINSYKTIFKFRSETENIDVLAVKIKKIGTMIKARTMQRQFIGRYLNGAFDGIVKDAALVAFYCDNKSDWRLSLVYKEYSFDNNGLKITLSEPRRCSFLVGTNELTHTAEQQIVNLLQITDRYTINRLKEAFSVERVTNEFFFEYKKLFQLLTKKVGSCLEKSKRTKLEFERCGINPAVYAKRLLGQIVFLYFLQKKGWLGVQNNERWGEGSHLFLQNIFNSYSYKNFFSDILNPLFYEALAIDRKDKNYYFELLKCRIPFLNGGLFEPIGGHDWHNVDITISNDFFRELFKIFERYNFTVREDEPLEREVAVDPEMLGKIFESLLDVDERRSQGTFYTPRWIVHYMCRESLIYYLDHKINYSVVYTSSEQTLPGVPPRKKLGTLPGVPVSGGIPREIRSELIPFKDIKQFIRYDEFQKNIEIDNKLKNTKLLTEHVQELPNSIKTNAKKLDDALANVKVCDPAIGSGAFAVGMMLEIVHARQCLHQAQPNLFRENGKNQNELPTTYSLKRDTIRNSLYGIDKDASAVDIAKLRLWLSLVVDEEDFYQIKPLPNLDYKIMVGDSPASWKNSDTLDYLYAQDLQDLQNQYFSEINHDKKLELKKNIERKRNEIDIIGNFDWNIDFPSVLSSKKQEKGFDIIIGNPPYIQIQKFNQSTKNSLKNKYTTYCGTGDIYCIFYELAFKIAKQHGIISYITSNKWMRADYGNVLRKFFSENSKVIKLIDFAGNKIFDSATVDVNIIILENTIDNKSTKTEACVIKDDCSANLSDYLEHNSVTTRFEVGQSWAVLSPIEQSIKQKIEAAGKPLKDWNVEIYRGILTGYNDAFIIDGATKDELILKDPKSAEIIRPILRGKDIKRYRYNFADQWLIATFPSRNYNIDNYPAVKKFLLTFGKERLEQSGKTYFINGQEIKSRKKTNNKWFETQDSISYWEDFSEQKIIWAELARTGNAFTYDSNQNMVLNTSYILVNKDNKISLKYILGNLNSKIILFYMNIISSKFDNNGWRWLKQFVEKLPILQNNNINIDNYVDKILKATKNKQVLLENELNYLIYDMYSLTEEEKKFIDDYNFFETRI